MHTRMVTNKRAISIALASLLLASCQPGGDLPSLPDYIVHKYTLGSGDQVRIITFGEDQLTGDFRVGDEGDIALPLLGDVHVAGLTTAQVDEVIAGQLRAKHLIRDPSVSTEVIRYRPVFVLGEVARPGEYPYRPNMTMLTAVAVAGGFTYRALEAYAEVVRTVDGHDKAVEGLIRPDSFIAPGDVIKVFMRRF
jgi:polysaccharide biosynthesis/export protein